ncbi:hypothetical protein [Aliivibrio logei]|uniref:hypothetical protein n=1 Tax=Aliivibrio logei TaxID=688 RepID=UPI0035C9085C
MEDILNIFDGRESIVQEIQEAEYELKCYVQQKLSEIITEYDFEMAVQSTSGGDSAREEMIFERLERCIEQ